MKNSVCGHGYILWSLLALPQIVGGVFSVQAQQADGGIAVPEVVFLPGGDAFIGDYSGSGDLDERPVHKSRIKQIGVSRTEITRGQYAPFAAERGVSIGDISGESATLPVVNVSYDDALQYARWLTSKTGDKWRLPIEAEWEYAARAGKHTLFQNGNDPKALCAAGNIADATALAVNPNWTSTDCSDGFAGIAPTESFMPNAFGLYDLHGNVWEWVDGCGEEYRRSGRSSFASCNELRGVRGGSYQSPAWSCRSSNRELLNKNFRRPDVGFRLVKE